MSHYHHDRVVTGRYQALRSALPRAGVADPFVVDVLAWPGPCVAGQAGPVGKQAALPPVPVSYRGQPFEVDNTTGGAGWPVLAGFGGLVLTGLGLVVWLASSGPALTALVLLLLLLVVVVAGLAVAGKKAGR